MSKIGTFEIQEKLKSNVKRSIFRVITPDGEVCILKILHQMGYSQLELTKMKKELEFSKNLDPRFVVCAKEFGVTEGNAYLTSDDFNGVSLDDLLSGEPMPIERFLPLAVHMVESLAYIHSKGIVHCDINPSNFIVSEDLSIVKINDFGLADYISRSGSTERADYDFSGTASYVAPEQTGRVNHNIDFRTDLYSLGVTFYELLIGEKPFVSEENDVLSLIHMHLATEAMPPNQLRNGIPIVLSDMIMKLLCKAPEQRYQSIYGLKEDLLKFKRLYESNEPTQFEIAQRDVLSYFVMPKTRFGRDVEVEIMTNIAFRVQNGNNECVALLGKRGVGKSFVLRELSKQFVKQGAFLINGACTIHQTGHVYQGLSNAIGQIINRLLVESEETILEVKEELEAEIGPNLGVLIKVIPSVEKLVGHVEFEGSFNPIEASTRFNQAFTKLLKVLKRDAKWVVIILDQLHLADEPTLNLIEYILDSTINEHLMVIGSVDVDVLNSSNRYHDLKMLLKDIRVSTVTLEALNVKNVEQFMFDSFKLPIAQGIILAETLFHKTDGNPYFIADLLHKLIEDKQLYFDYETGRWDYNLDAVQKLPITRNVVDSIIKRISAVDANTIKIMQICAVFSDRILSSLVYELAGMSYSEFIASLTLALDSGFLKTNDNLTDFIIAQSLEHHDIYLRFVEDELKLEILKTLSSEELLDLRYRVGMIYYTTYQSMKSNRLLIDIVFNLNHSQALITDQKVRINLAKYNFEIAMISKQAVAYKNALEAIESAVLAIGQQPFENYYDLSFDVYLERAELKYLNKQFEEAELEFDWLFDVATSNLDKVRVNRIKLILYVNLGETHKVVSLAIKTLELLDMRLSEKLNVYSLLKDLVKVRYSKPVRQPGDILRLPIGRDERSIMILEILNLLISVSYLIDKSLFIQIILKMMLISMSHGIMRLSPFAFATYGIVEAALFKRYVHALRLGKTGIELAKTVNDFEALSKTNFTVGFFLSHWVNHIADSIPYLEEGQKFSHYSGDMVYYAYNTAGKYIAMLSSGTNLETMTSELDLILKDVEVLRVKDVSNLLVALKQYVYAQSHGTDNYKSLTTEGFDESEFERKLRTSNMPSILAHYMVLKMKLLYTFGDYEEVCDIASNLKPILGELMGLYIAVEYHYYLALALLARDMNPQRLKYDDSRIKNAIRSLKQYSNANPTNFAHKYHHVKGCVYFKKNQYENAHQELKLALQSANEKGFAFEEALISESLADCYERQNLARLSKTYIKEAYMAFRQLGCHVKCEMMIKTFQEIEFHSLDFVNLEMSRSIQSHSNRSKQLDTIQIMKSTQRLSTEFEEEKLIRVVLELLQEVAGSQRAKLIFKDNGLKIIAELQGEVFTHYNEAVSVHRSHMLPESVVNYVHRTQESVLLENAHETSQFSNDDYIKNHHVLSLLCIPVYHKGHYYGLLYMENNLMSRAFREERLEILRVILNQFTIAYDNAQLYRALEKSQSELLVHQENLEDLVRERTFELSKTKLAIENLLNYVGQGFLSISESGIINPAYSKECITIFNHEIGGERFETLFAPYSSGMDATLIRGVVEKIFELESYERINAYMSLLPERLLINARTFESSYRFIANKYIKQITVILTDITEKLQLEREMEEERQNLKMIVNVIRYQNNFKSSLKRLREFFEHDYLSVLKVGSVNDALAEVYRIIHTFKGDFAQWSLAVTASKLHVLENDLQHLFAGKQNNMLTPERLKSYLENIDVDSLIQVDLTKINQYLGDNFINSSQIIQLDTDDFEAIRAEVLSLLPERYHLDVIRVMQQFKYVKLSEVLKQYNDYILNLASSFRKEVKPIIIEGEDIKLDETVYLGFLKSLIHIFRNSLQYGIETTDERVLLNKPAQGTIRCMASESASNFSIQIMDDGAGLDVQLLSNRLVAMGESVDDKSTEDIKQAIFDHGFSTGEEVTEVSGRGVGLNAVFNEVIHLGGHISVKSEAGKFTAFEISLPKINNNSIG
ncbi:MULTISPECIES: AAA family ATPase [unclassified Fusibacter]|uniref:protein kinase domain-containing protein n=1 Tax=unclassified Fusibacter TaxID=2624464 RepID=UPI00101203E7|nr:MULTISPECIES: AAA family ATPase [unclassified Fusibacter]MCK8061181.1 AAA family ATPase [Fusibacter sp. A2]NPE23282.1 AAA family ATPase [Fusibacter sp. A1]RXV59325.1 GAF domain-containing protein [Fusibacter sp. A1]